MVRSVCVGFEVHIRHEHSCNGSCIDPISLGFAETQVFSLKVGVQRIDDIGWQTFAQQKSENVIAVVSSSLKSAFYFVCWTDTATNGL